MYVFIQVKDGKPINHPALPSNLIQAFGDIPSDWEPFLRVSLSRPGVYQTIQEGTDQYQKVDGVWTDSRFIRDMTPEEKAAKQQSVKDAWAARPQAQNWAAWVFDENICAYKPPVPRPDDVEGKIVFWCGAENNWKEAPQPPTPAEGKKLDFDFFAWQWVEVSK
jgi:hypothetical protein